MKYYLMLLLTFGLSYTATAQTSSTEPSQIQEFSQPTTTIQESRNVEFRGTQYFNKSWEKGYVIFSSGSKSKTVDLRYSSYGNELLFKQNGNILAVIPQTFSGFVLMIEGKNLTFKKGYSSDEFDISNSQILQVMHEGDVQLLVHHQNRLQRGNRPDPLTGITTNRFRKYEYNYLVDSNGKWHKVDLDEDDILEAIGEKKGELRSFADNNDLDFEDQYDLSKILAKYDEINANE